MKNSGYKFLAILIVSFSFTNITFAQDSKENLKKRKPDFLFFTLFNKSAAINAKKLIVYGKDGDGFPDKIKVTGTIVGANAAQKVCGFTGGNAGTLKIKLDEQVKDYENEYLYVIVSCLFSRKGNEEFLNKKIEISAKKMVKYPYQSSVFLVNDFDTKGVPFYVSDDSGSLLRQKIRIGNGFEDY